MVNPNRPNNVDDIVYSTIKQKIDAGLITYAPPTSDHTYKRVFLCTTDNKGVNTIGKNFANALLKLSMPNVPLSTREVKVQSEYVDEVFKNFYLAVKPFVDVPEPQNLKVDALYCADMNDKRRAERTRQTRNKAIIQKPAYILGEMQVCEQNFGVRLMSYIGKIFGGNTVNLKNNQIPLPVYGDGVCMWENESFVQNQGYMNSAGVENKCTERTNLKFTEVSGCNVYLGKSIDIKNDDTREDLNNKLSEGRENLKKNITYFFGKNAFEDLSDQEKKVYLWLEFIAFAHLMTTDDVNTSLGCLAGEADKNVFKQAYEAIKYNIKGNKMSVIDRMKNNYRDLWGVTEAAIFNVEVEQVARLANITADNINIIQPDLLTDQDLAKKVYKELKQRQVSEDKLRAFAEVTNIELVPEEEEQQQDSGEVTQEVARTKKQQRNRKDRKRVE